MITLLSGMDLQLFGQRLYVISNTDKMSQNKIIEFENKVCFPIFRWLSFLSLMLLKCKNEGSFEIYRIPRSREVLQSYLSSIFTTIRSLIHSIFLVFRLKPDVVSFFLYLYFNLK